MIILGEVRNGQIILQGTRIKNFEGKEVEIDINVRTLKRSGAHNRYYHGCVIPCVIEVFKETQGVACTKDQACEFCKRAFVGVDRLAGVDIGRSTRGMDSREFSDYIERIRAWCYHFGNYVVPSAEQYQGFGTTCRDGANA